MNLYVLSLNKVLTPERVVNINDIVIYAKYKVLDDDENIDFYRRLIFNNGYGYDSVSSRMCDNTKAHDNTYSNMPCVSYIINTDAEYNNCAFNLLKELLREDIRDRNIDILLDKKLSD